MFRSLPSTLVTSKEAREPQVKYLRYDFFWERESSLKELIDSAWKILGHMLDLGSINRGLATVMKTLH
jgi:hypothetical protein